VTKAYASIDTNIYTNFYLCIVQGVNTTGKEQKLENTSLL